MKKNHSKLNYFQLMLLPLLQKKNRDFWRENSNNPVIFEKSQNHCFLAKN